MIESQQILKNYTEAQASMGIPQQSGVQDYMGLKADVDTLLASFPIVGAGNPNGVITSNASLLYVDATGPTLYVNTSTGVNTGWNAV